MYVVKKVKNGSRYTWSGYFYGESGGPVAVLNSFGQNDDDKKRCIKALKDLRKNLKSDRKIEIDDCDLKLQKGLHFGEKAIYKIVLYTENSSYNMVFFTKEQAENWKEVVSEKHKKTVLEETSV